MMKFSKCSSELVEIAKDLKSLLLGDISLNVFLAKNFPSFYSLSKGGRAKYMNFEANIPPNLFILLPEDLAILSGCYSTPNCHIEKGDIVLDVGAHVGYFTLYAIRSGAKKVFAFEPNPYVFRILKKHIVIWHIEDKVKLYNICLYKTKTKKYLYIENNPLSTVSTILEKRQGTVLENFHYTQKILVPCETVDNIVRKEKLEDVNFIKIDTEGSEKEVLLGAKETIKRFKPKIVVSAYHKPDDEIAIKNLVTSIRKDYRFEIIENYEKKIFFY